MTDRGLDPPIFPDESNSSVFRLFCVNNVKKPLIAKKSSKTLKRFYQNMNFFLIWKTNDSKFGFQTEEKNFFRDGEEGMNGAGGFNMLPF